MNELQNLKLKMFRNEVKNFAHETIDNIFKFADDYFDILSETENQNSNQEILVNSQTQPERNPNDLLTAKEAAEFLNVKESSIRAWRYQGKLSAQKIGRCTRFLISDLINFQIRESALNQSPKKQKQVVSHSLRVVKLNRI
jgi:excisionase family DNA binding protein